MNDNHIFSLYVTDYTPNSAMSPIGGSWCPAGLTDSVLKVEVWDDAIGAAQGLQEGEFCSIKNLRMRVSHGGFLEGKLNESKIRRLDEADASFDVQLQALLEYVFCFLVLLKLLIHN